MTDENAAGASAMDGIDVETITSNPKPEPAAAEKPAAPAEEHEDGDEHSDKKKSGWARQRDRLRAENENLKAELAKLQPTPAPQAAPTDAPKGRPDVKDYKDVLEYVRADNEWLADQKIEAYEKSQKDKAEKASKDKVYQEKVGSYNERLAPVLEKIPEFPERIQEFVDEGLITANLESAVLDSPIGELVSVYLLNNVNDLQQISQMNEAQTYRAVALIEAHIKQSMNQSEAPVAKKTTAAAPINPIGKKASTSTKSPADMDQQEFEAAVAKLNPRR